jgi:hypothetical protein
VTLSWGCEPPELPSPDPIEIVGRGRDPLRYRYTVSDVDPDLIRRLRIHAYRQRLTSEAPLLNAAIAAYLTSLELPTEDQA